MYRKITVFNLAFLLLFLSCATTERNNPFDAEGQNWNPPMVTARTDTTARETIAHTGGA